MINIPEGCIEEFRRYLFCKDKNIVNKDSVNLNEDEKWSKYESSSPLYNIKSAQHYLFCRFGWMPEFIMMSSEIFDCFCSHPDAIDYFKYLPDGKIDRILGLYVEIIEKEIIGNNVYIKLVAPKPHYCFDFDLPVYYIIKSVI